MTTETSPVATGAARAENPMLALQGLHVYYGNIAAVKGLTMHVRQGEIVTLIGSNGAGKSTTLRTVSGLLHARQGSVTFKGQDISKLPGHKVVAAGISQSPEGRRIFPRMTVAENLDLGAFLRKDAAGVAEDLERVLELFPRLRERLAQKAGTLSGGEQQMLAGRPGPDGPAGAAAARRALDGPGPVLVDLIFDTIQTIRDQGTTVLVVEQNALAACASPTTPTCSSRAPEAPGPGKDLAKDEGIVRAYLGG
jgi:branched-chain amino acid transport system ATP-binding protein